MLLLKTIGFCLPVKRSAHAIVILSIPLVVQVEQSVGAVCVCLCVRTMTFEWNDLWPKFWRAGSPSPCPGHVRMSRSLVEVRLRLCLGLGLERQSEIEKTSYGTVVKQDIWIGIWKLQLSQQKIQQSTKMLLNWSVLPRVRVFWLNVVLCGCRRFAFFCNR